MAMRGNAGNRRYTKRKSRPKRNESDESDEDFTLGEDETDEWGDDTEESLGESEEEEEDEKVRKVGRSRGKKIPGVKKKSGVGKKRKKSSKSYQPDDEDEDDSIDEEYDFNEDEDDDFEEEEDKKKRKVSRSKGKNVCGGRKRNATGKKRKRGTGGSNSRKVEDDDDFIVEDEDDDDYEDEDEGEEDDEFRPDESESNDEDEIPKIIIKENVKRRPPSRKKGLPFWPQRKRVSKIQKEPGRKNPTAARGQCRKSSACSGSSSIEKSRVAKDEDEDEDEGEEDYEFRPDESESDDEDEIPKIIIKENVKRRPPSREKGLPFWPQRKRVYKIRKEPVRKNPTAARGQCRKRSACSGSSSSEKSRVAKEKSKKQKRKRSFIVDSGPSDLEYTTSDEQREHVMEASQFCIDLTASLRNSYSPNKCLGESFVGQQRKRSERKGKEKVEVVKDEVAKQVCGICLSEESESSVQGKLNCCSHYFCFVCVMEWSKVESRCPLCKQRFVTVSKSERSKTGLDLKTVVVQVPERDQVYQPSEEELRVFLDPYENAICTECHLGGDDALMLLCDLCDSPAHTYCVGLGREVPEDNWYCEGCRPTALASPNPEAQFLTPSQRRTSSPAVNATEEAIDLNSLYVPETPQPQGTEASPFQRRRARDFQVASPTSGMGVLTVLARRRMQDQLRILSENRIEELSRMDIGRRRLPATMFENPQVRSTVDRRREYYSQANAPERFVSHQNLPQRRLQDNLPFFSTDRFPSRVQDPASTSAAASSSRMLQSEFPGTSAGISSSMAGDGSSLNGYREVSDMNLKKERVQSMVRGYLKSISREINLGYNTFKIMARSSTHTVLAMCGLEHRRSEVFPVQQPSTCKHLEAKEAGEASIMEGFCSSCFDSLVNRVVRKSITAFDTSRN